MAALLEVADDLMEQGSAVGAAEGDCGEAAAAVDGQAADDAGLQIDDETVLGEVDPPPAGHVTPPTSAGARTDGRSAGTMGAATSAAGPVPVLAVAPSAPQRAIPDALTYGQWSARGFAISMIMVWAGLALPLATKLIE